MEEVELASILTGATAGAASAPRIPLFGDAVNDAFRELFFAASFVLRQLCRALHATQVVRSDDFTSASPVGTTSSSLAGNGAGAPFVPVGDDAVNWTLHYATSLGFDSRAAFDAAEKSSDLFAPETELMASAARGRARHPSRPIAHEAVKGALLSVAVLLEVEYPSRGAGNAAVFSFANNRATLFPSAPTASLRAIGKFAVVGDDTVYRAWAFVAFFVVHMRGALGTTVCGFVEDGTMPQTFPTATGCAAVAPVPPIAVVAIDRARVLVAKLHGVKCGASNTAKIYIGHDIALASLDATTTRV